METTTPTTPATTEPKLWMSIIQTANYLEMSRSTVERFLRESGLPHSKVAKSVRINKNQLDQWLLDHEIRHSIKVGV